MLNSERAIRTTEQIITPEMAKAWLEHNTNNRKLTLRLVLEYARAMQENRWMVNGETIKIARDGRLVDGQHRLQACVKAGVAFTAIVVTGVEFDTFDTIDKGRKRTTGDDLGMDGIRNSAAVAAAVKWVTAYRTGAWHINNVTMSSDETRLFVAANPDIEDSVARSQNCRDLLYPSLGGALHYLFAEKASIIEADAFMSDLANGANLAANDPVFVLREKLIKDRMTKAKLPKAEVFSMCIRAWARRRSKSSVTLLRGSIVMKEGDKKKFPQIV